MNHLLITGATGFVGSHAIDCALAAGFRVTAVARSLHPDQVAVVEYRNVDLFDSAQVATLLATTRPTHLLHTAWVVAPGECWSSPDNGRWVDASRNLLRAFADAGGQRVVITGTCAEYDWETPQPCDEATTPIRPQTAYGRCKDELRTWTTDFARTLGIGFAWARLFFLYGPREHPDRLVSLVARSLIAGTPVACTAGTQRRDYLHVRDAADALVCLLQSDLTGSVNVGSGEAIAVRELVEEVARACGQPELVQFGARPTSPNEPPILVAHINRLRDELGWHPRISLPTGVATTVQWWRDQLARSGINPQRLAG